MVDLKIAFSEVDTNSKKALVIIQRLRNMPPSIFANIEAQPKNAKFDLGIDETEINGYKQLRCDTLETEGHQLPAQMNQRRFC